MSYRALDLFCAAGGMSYGLELAGFEVTGVDIGELVKPKKKPAYRRPHRHRGGTYIMADAMDVLLDLAYLRSFNFIHASPPCQGYSSLRHLQKGKAYPDLIAQVRASLIASGVPYSIENVPGAPLGGNLTMLCGTMFGLQTPDGRAEIRRHRLFETSWPIALRPACQHGWGAPESMSVTGTGMGVGGKARWRERQALTVTGAKGLPGKSHARRGVITVTGDRCNSSNTPRVLGMYGGKAQDRTYRKGHRETFSVADARAAMQIDWMPMKSLSQAIPPAYAFWIGRQAISYLSGSS